eukprot:NODE_101_length_20473_cov_0.516590.p1 type:complete len:1017 gc:universal NODE_101_length_20473_cov_0.516590:17268-20318(+)
MLLVNLVISSVKLFPSHFEIHGKPTLLRSGSLQWYRIPKTEWRDRLYKFSNIFNMLEMYVSWQHIEPEPNVFKTQDLIEFLDLVKEHNIYVYFRPGPFISNEENSGGIPAWVIAKSNKIINPHFRDGYYALRTNDFDYLEIVERYFNVINRIIKPYLVTNGGFIVLYQIENEYDHFEHLFELEKSTKYEGEQERLSGSTLDTLDMFNKLRSMVEKHIDIPINTCPGSLELNGMGNASRILPLPNYYKSANYIEYSGMKYKNNQQKLINYLNFPSGISETFRSPSTISRFVISGMDMVNSFNAFGFFQPGRKNSLFAHFKGVVDETQIWKILKVLFPLQDIRDYRTFFFRFPIGLFPSVTDFNGPVSPSGQIRLSYSGFRRLHLFYNAFEHILAPANKCQRSTTGKVQDKILSHSNNVIVKNPQIGTPSKDTRRNVVYWLPITSNNQDGAIIGLVSHLSSITVEPYSITAFNISFPKYPFIIPKNEHITINSPLNQVNSNSDDFYLMHIPVNIPISEDFTIKYSTAEILTFTNDKWSSTRYSRQSLLMLYGVVDSVAEIEFSVQGDVQFYSSFGYKFKKHESGLFTSFKIQSSPFTLHLIASNHILTIIVMDRYLSGRTYIAENGILMGCDLYNPLANTMSFITDSADFYTYGISSLNSRFEEEYVNQPNISSVDGSAGLKAWRVDHDINYVKPIVIKAAFQTIDTTNTDSTFIKLPRLLESELLNMTEGYITYKSEFVLDKVSSRNKLYIEHASDFVSVFINNKYLTSLVPLGSRINSDDGHFRFRFKIPSETLVVGTNTVILKCDVWGRGSFICPKGKVSYVPIFNYQVPIGFSIEIPQLGNDANKGIYGRTTFNDKELKWGYSIGLTGEKEGYYKKQHGRTKIEIPHKVKGGDIEFINFNVRLPKSMHKIPFSLKLKGKDLKADIYMNDEIIGRWISDEGWLQKSRENIDRNALSLMNMDHFPIPSGYEEIHISLLLDSKGDGVLEHVEVGISEEMLDKDAKVHGQYERVYNLE